MKPRMTWRVKSWYICSTITEIPTLKELVIWSDGCGYQNRNVIIANAYSAFARVMQLPSFKSSLLQAIHKWSATPYIAQWHLHRARIGSYHPAFEVQTITIHCWINGTLTLPEDGEQILTSIRPGKSQEIHRLIHQSGGTAMYKLSFNTPSPGSNHRNKMGSTVPTKTSYPNAGIQWPAIYEGGCAIWPP